MDKAQKILFHLAIDKDFSLVGRLGSTTVNLNRFERSVSARLFLKSALPPALC